MEADPAFGPYEAARWALGQRVRNRDTGAVGVVYAFVAWEPPLLCYGVRLPDGGEVTWHNGDMEGVRDGA